MVRIVGSSGSCRFTNTIHNVLTNPIYACAYAFGRTGSRVSIRGGHKKERVIPAHHEGYLSWVGYARNLGLIVGNANGKTPMSAVRCARGEVLLAICLAVSHPFSRSSPQTRPCQPGAVDT